MSAPRAAAQLFRMPMWLAYSFRPRSERRAQPRFIRWKAQYARDDRYVVSFNPGAHPVAQKLKIGAVNRVTARGEKHGVALERFQTQGIRLGDALRGRNNQCR